MWDIFSDIKPKMVEQTGELLVILGAMKLMWGHGNAYDIYTFSLHNKHASDSTYGVCIVGISGKMAALYPCKTP